MKGARNQAKAVKLMELLSIGLQFDGSHCIMTLFKMYLSLGNFYIRQTCPQQDHFGLLQLLA
jgi:hypothetical protein